jgi:hypothetical protein
VLFIIIVISYLALFFWVFSSGCRHIPQLFHRNSCWDDFQPFCCFSICPAVAVHYRYSVHPLFPAHHHSNGPNWAAGKSTVSLNTVLNHAEDFPKKSDRCCHLPGKERRAATRQSASSASALQRCRKTTLLSPRSGTSCRICSGVNRSQSRALPGGISSSEKEEGIYSYGGRYSLLLAGWLLRCR